MIARRVVIMGRVQGVGFRESMVDIAQADGLTGWVRNLRDGTVEALLQGPDDAVERVLQWCRKGPRTAHVTHVQEHSCEIDETLHGFARRSTV
jgi:acylphosphatase